MPLADRLSRTGGGLLRIVAVHRWAIWAVPSALLMSILTVEFTSIVLVGLGMAGAPGRPEHDLRMSALVCVVGIVHAEIARDVERTRRHVVIGDLHVNLGSIWFFAAAVLVSPAWAGLCAVVIHTHLWWRANGPRSQPYRQIFTTAVIVLACYASSAVMEYLRGMLGGPSPGRSLVAVPVLVVGILVFLTVNSALVAGVIAVSNPHAKVDQLVGDWDENLLEITTLCLGALVAVMMTINPWLVLFVLPPLLVLHRAALVRHLEEAACTDSKTGLLTAAAWHTRAEHELQRVGRGDGPRAVLVLDLDHFKAVNDTHGHMAGDHVLAAVADALRSEVRDRDLVGRFGGEEFVVLLSGSHGGVDTDLEAVADRIRRRVAALRVEIPTADGPLTIAGLSISVGGAVHPGGVGDLRELLQVADTALYSAKRAGRNMVRMGSLPGSRPPVPVLRTITPVADAQ